MQVKKIMSKNVVTVPIEASLDEAMALMKKYEIRHLPVVEGKKLIGLVTDRDIRSAIFPAIRGISFSTALLRQSGQMKDMK